MRRMLITAMLALETTAAAPARLSEAEVRAFAAKQETAWNAGDVAGYFALFAPGARFTDQALANTGKMVPYGTASLAEARAQAERFFAKSRIRETSTIKSIAIARDGRSAKVVAHETAEITTAGKLRRSCADTEQTVVVTAAGLRSLGQTETIVRCR